MFCFYPYQTIIQVELILFVSEIMVKFFFYINIKVISHVWYINIKVTYLKYFSFSLPLQSHFSHEPRVCACISEFSFFWFFMSLDLIFFSLEFWACLQYFLCCSCFLFHISILDLICFHEVIFLRFSFGFLWICRYIWDRILIHKIWLYLFIYNFS